MVDALPELLFAAWAVRVEGGEALDCDDLFRAHPEHAEELRRLHDDWKLFAPLLGKVVPGLLASNAGIVVAPLSGDDQDAVEVPSSEFLDRLRIHVPNSGRYRFRSVIGRGGGGVVLKVWDTQLNRPLAMKVVLGRGEDRLTGDTPVVDGRVLARFVDEARIASQLNHPGIVPVHELGADETGRAFFTMKLVKGEDLSLVFDHVKTRHDGWNQTRALGVLLRVCEAMSYAHAKHVIHRDLKPANVMVGPYGEVYVMDWGLARVVGEKDSHDLRIRLPPRSPASMVESVRHPNGEAGPHSPLMTMDGTVVGTPAYMSPEQARGELDKVGVRSDVYSIGAMLYELSAGQAPFVRAGESPAPQVVWMRVAERPPDSLLALAPRAPAELVAICEKAMARDWRQRYRDMSELAADLSAYLERRVVLAYETGTWAETKKWVGRNRSLAASLATAIALLVLGVVVSGQQARRADAKTSDVLSLSAIQELKEIVERADLLWPAMPDKVQTYDNWLADAKVLVEGCAPDPARGRERHPSLKDHEAKLAEIRLRAKPYSSETGAGGLPTWEFENAQDRWWYAQLSQLVADLRAFSDERSGLFSEGTSEQHGWGIARRRTEAASIEARSVSGAEAKRRWHEAIASIARSDKYGGLKMTPQLGLLPIGQDSDSLLWEFAHVQTGTPAERGADARLKLTEETGLVFVLLPGGSFWMGAQNTEPSGRNYDPQSNQNESPPHEVKLDAYFLSKYEMTQGQWTWLTGRNPSQYGPGTVFGGKATTLLSPVEQVSWPECAGLMSRVGLSLPTEAQWEYADRAATKTPWWTGENVHSLDRSANLADKFGKDNGGPSSGTYEEWLDDGFTAHAPVGSFRANAFGLHDMIGNVWEWCRDGYGGYTLLVREGDGERQVSAASYRVCRGGGFSSIASYARSAKRDYYSPENRDLDVGVRPARAITP